MGSRFDCIRRHPIAGNLLNLLDTVKSFGWILDHD
jgi:hypothetical protein